MGLNRRISWYNFNRWEVASYEGAKKVVSWDGIYSRRRHCEDCFSCGNCHWWMRLLGPVVSLFNCKGGMKRRLTHCEWLTRRDGKNPACQDFKKLYQLTQQPVPTHWTASDTVSVLTINLSGIFYLQPNANLFRWQSPQSNL